jgi:hypothetical protein
LELIAGGAQIYDCAANDRSFDWALKASEANLFQAKGIRAEARVSMILNPAVGAE